MAEQAKKTDKKQAQKADRKQAQKADRKRPGRAEKKEEEQRIERALVIGAHPDDPEFGFGGSVAKLADDGVEVYYCICTDGSQGGEDPSVPDEELTTTRYREQRAAAEVLGVRDVVFLGFRDGYLAPDIPLRKALTREIRRLRPDLVMTHAPLMSGSAGIGASHPDHLAVGQAALAAVYPDSRNPRCYPELLTQGFQPHRVREVWLPGFDAADHFVDTTKTLERKIQAIMCHSSQFEGKPRMGNGGPGERIREWGKQVGKRAGYQYAEAFKKLQTG